MTENVTEAQARKSIRSKDFRNIAADAFGVRANDNFVQLMFSLESSDFQTGETIFIEEMLVSLPPRALKVLSIILSDMVNLLETAGGVIELPPNKMEEMKKAKESALAAIRQSRLEA